MMGQPAKLRRRLAPEDLESIDAYAQRYVEYKEIYRIEAKSTK
jgi:carbonic anhydrase/acetyltransferase-like protein (isoleucine patch superfamily)